MARKKHSPEEIVALLRQIEVAIANGQLTPQACCEAGARSVKAQSVWPRRGIESAPRGFFRNFSAFECQTEQRKLRPWIISLR